MTTTDTPRTDAELEKPRDGVYSSFFSMASHAKQLERELAASQVEVNRLRETNAKLEISLSFIIAEAKATLNQDNK